MRSSSKHWDRIFSTTDDDKLGWYEKDSSNTMKVLNKIPDWEKSTIFIPGVGTSELTEDLLKSGANLVLNDISIEALNRVKARVGDKCAEITWMCQDIAEPFKDRMLKIDIWIDRAVLHFLTDEKDIEGYFHNVKSNLNINGYVIFAEFSKISVSKCAGLNLHRYSIKELSEKLGSSFTLVTHFDHIYINPNGDPRPYIYSMYKRIE
jgi:EEF1A lysine methyltransferase 2